MNNLLELCEVQAGLDGRIRKEKNIELTKRELLRNTLVALDIELAEFANDARWFKIWSHNQTPKPTTLEEYVDSLHFFLSIANLQEWREHLRVTIEENTGDYDFDNPKRVELVNATYLEMKHQLARVFTAESTLAFTAAWTNFLTLGIAGYGYTWKQISEAYLAKNKINHERQTNGY